MPASIPKHEFAERAAKLQAAMKAEGFDAILAYGNEAEPQYARYFSDYWPSFETAGVLIPAEGKPLLLIGPESLTYAADRSVIQDIRMLKAFRESSEPEYPGKVLDTFAGVFDEVLPGRKLTKVGVAGLPLTTIGVYNALVEDLAKLGSPAIVKADELVNNLRMIKSENELICMSEAANITHKAFDYLLENIHPGMTELQAAGLALGKMHELGAERESFPFWILSGDGGNQAISRARHKVIQPGDEAQIQIGARVASYASTIGRCVVFGKATDVQRRMIEAGYALHQYVLDHAKAGLSAAALAKGYVDKAREIGFDDWLLYGPLHGNGTMEGEAPWVETSAAFDLKENMTFSLDVFLGNDKTKRGLRIEDVIRIKNGGVENLTNYPKRLFEL
ncbi:peptidase M24 [Clostridia bacterium]|nr:peptidase M24 [Clostridia bacterium]